MSTLSIVIVTMNRRDELLRLLSDLCDTTAARRAEILVVDNGSGDGTAGAVRQGFANVRLIRNETNEGAPGARNEAARCAGGELIVFLDDDTRVEDPTFCDKIVQAFEEEPDAAVIAFRILEPATRQPRSFEIPARRKELDGTRFATSYFIAAGCAVRRAAYEELGGMDADLIYGFEELDLGYRAVAAGHDIIYRPEIELLHGLSSTGRPGGRALFFFLRNKIWISVRYLPWPMVLTQIGVWGGYFFWESLRAGRPDLYVRALWAGITGAIPRLARRRTDRLSATAIARLKKLDGRLYT
ncbi:MAG: glycosyltransferase family 2 protein [Acidobacteriota bacterium]